MAVHRDCAAAEIDDASDQGEAQSVSLRCVGSVCLIELIKDVVQIALADAAAAVRHTDRGIPGFLLQTYPDSSPFWSEFHCIGEEIGPDAVQQVLVLVQDQVLIQVRVQFNVLLCELLIIVQDAAGDRLTGIEGQLLRMNLLVVKAVHLEDVGDKD